MQLEEKDVTCARGEGLTPLQGLAGNRKGRAPLKRRKHVHNPARGLLADLIIPHNHTYFQQRQQKPAVVSDEIRGGS